MRSRYVAYTEANVADIGRTMKAPAKNSFDPKSAKKWAKRVKWLNLEVKASSIIQASKGFVEFIACFEEQGKIIKMHEFSEFHLENGEWYYVDGKNLR